MGCPKSHRQQVHKTSLQFHRFCGPLLSKPLDYSSPASYTTATTACQWETHQRGEHRGAPLIGSRPEG
jgi:hypothetical protein